MQDLKIKATNSIMFYEEHGKSFAVHWKKEGDKWGEPEALSNDNLKELTSSCASIPYVLPKEMLWYEEGKLMFWYSPPRRQMLRQTKLSEIKDKDYSHPPLIFRVHRDDSGCDTIAIAVVSYDFFRLRELNKHHEEVIYESPYGGHDVNYNTGNVGICRVACPNKDFAYDLEGESHQIWAEAFYESEFNKRPIRCRTGRHKQLKPTTTTVIDWMQQEL
jgi:hypothetical protein